MIFMMAQVTGISKNLEYWVGYALPISTRLLILMKFIANQIPSTGVND